MNNDQLVKSLLVVVTLLSLSSLIVSLVTLNRLARTDTAVHDAIGAVSDTQDMIRNN